MTLHHKTDGHAMKLSPIQYIRAALANAMAEDLDMSDVWQAIEEAETPAQFDANINAIVQARDITGHGRPGYAYCEGRWIRID